MGICDGILSAAIDAAERSGAKRINSIEVSIGELTEVIEDPLQFAFDVLRRGTIASDATLDVTFLPARSVCVDCGKEFGHGRFDAKCPSCGSLVARLIQGRELRIDAIDID
ncbi:MAG: hydrogenase maturation nickel metallochaperone HypA [Coriobacteriales bacterium]